MESNTIGKKPTVTSHWLNVGRHCRADNVSRRRATIGKGGSGRRAIVGPTMANYLGSSYTNKLISFDGRL